MRILRISMLLAAFSTVAPLAAAAHFGVRAGRFQDGNDTFVGAEVLIDAGTININPNIEYWLVDDATAGTANVDITFDLIQVGSLRPYLGAGVGVAYTDHELAGSTTDVVGNLIGGVAFQLATLQPYAQAKYFRLLDNEEGNGASDEVALMIGLRF